jgi:hypothetical protein
LIENSLDKLKLHFEQSGLQLGNISVNADTQGHLSREHKSYSNPYISSQNEENVPALGITSANVSDQLLDLYI